MNKLFTELEAAEQKMAGMSTKEAQDEYQKASIKPIEDKIKAVKEALTQYEDTKELLEQLDEQLQEAIWAW
jgi:phosphopantetheine adenylyltransferase